MPLTTAVVGTVRGQVRVIRPRLQYPINALRAVVMPRPGAFIPKTGGRDAPGIAPEGASERDGPRDGQAIA